MKILTIIAAVAFAVPATLSCQTKMDEEQYTPSNKFALTANERASLEKAAHAGDANAAFRMFLFYSQVVRDEPKANKWLRMAATLNHPTAQYNLGLDLFEFGAENEKAEGLKWLQSAAALGDESARKYLDEMKPEGSSESDPKGKRSEGGKD